MLLTRPLLLTVFTWLLTLITAVLVLWVVTGHYTITESVAGMVVPDDALARVRTRWLQPEDDGDSEGDAGEEGSGAAVIAGCDPPPVLEPTEHEFDSAAPPVAAFVVSDGLVAGSATRDARLNALGLESVAEPISVVAAVAEQPLRLRQSSSSAAAPV